MHDHHHDSDAPEQVEYRPKGPVARILARAVLFYQKYISGLKMGSTCRFEPTCSRYALEALTVHGAFKGLILTVVRISKCGPWHPGGYDPIPATGRWATDTVICGRDP